MFIVFVFYIKINYITFIHTTHLLTEYFPIKAFQGTYISFLRIQLNDIYYHFLKSFLRQYIIFISGSIGQ